MTPKQLRFIVGVFLLIQASMTPLLSQYMLHNLPVWVKEDPVPLVFSTAIYMILLIIGGIGAIVTAIDKNSP